MDDDADHILFLARSHETIGDKELVCFLATLAEHEAATSKDNDLELNLDAETDETCKELFHFMKAKFVVFVDLPCTRRQIKQNGWICPPPHHLTKQHQVFGHLKFWHCLLPGLTGDDGLTATTSASMVDRGKILYARRLKKEKLQHDR